MPLKNVEILAFCPLSSVKTRVACFDVWLALQDLRGNLGGFARELAGLNCPICFRIHFILSFTDFTVWQILQKMSLSTISLPYCGFAI
jgi:hypothetical protein